MGDLVECSCDKNRIMRRFQYSTKKLDDIGDHGVDGFNANDNILGNGQHYRNKKRHQHRRHNNNNNRQEHDNYLLRNRNIYRNVILPEGDWEWGGCGKFWQISQQTTAI